MWGVKILTLEMSEHNVRDHGVSHFGILSTLTMHCALLGGVNATLSASDLAFWWRCGLTSLMGLLRDMV